MLKNPHNLDHIIAMLHYLRQHQVLKGGERMHFRLDTTHADMTLIHPKVGVLPGWLRVLELIVLEGDIHSIKGMIIVLVGIVYPGRDSIFHLTVGKFHFTLNLRKGRDGFVYLAFPVPVFILHLSYGILSMPGISFVSSC